MGNLEIIYTPPEPPYVRPKTFRNIPNPQVNFNDTLFHFYFNCLLASNTKFLLSKSQMREACEYLLSKPETRDFDIPMTIRVERMLDCRNLPSDMYMKILDVIEPVELIKSYFGLSYRIVSHPQVTTGVLVRMREWAKKYGNEDNFLEGINQALISLREKPYRLDFMPKKGWDKPNKKELQKAYVSNQRIILALESILDSE